eukprot:8752811-Alexandrium_andersonii.AAC.1
MSDAPRSRRAGTPRAVPRLGERCLTGKEARTASLNETDSEQASLRAASCDVWAAQRRECVSRWAPGRRCYALLSARASG